MFKLPKRTTILLADDICEKLVGESLRRYKTTKAIMKVPNESLKRALKGEAKVLDLVFTQKSAKTRFSMSGPVDWESLRGIMKGAKNVTSVQSQHKLWSKQD